ncbi:MAG: M48 family metallopeptidase [Bdellovibrionota bacterium]
MEPQTLDPAAAVKGLAILAAIPVVLFALWCEYFARHLQTLTEEDPRYDKSAEIYRVRIAGLCVFAFQIILYLGTADIRQVFPKIGVATLLTAIALQAIVQADLERKLRRDRSSPREQLMAAFRAIFSILMGAGAYALILLGCVHGASLITSLIHATPGPATLILFVAGIAGVVCGLAFNFALGPIHLRNFFRTHPVTDPELLGLLTKCFDSAKIRTPAFWVIENTQFQIATALTAGFASGRGWFRPAVFVSRSTLDRLDPEELGAVLLHEVSHIQLRHLRKRFLFSAGLIIATTLAASFLVLLAFHYFKGEGESGLIGPLVGLFSFFVSFKMIGEQGRLQEFEADIHCIEKLGATLENLASALRKLDQLNQARSDRRDPHAILSGNGHPATELRIRILHRYFEFKRLGKLRTPDSGKKAA